ncbi:hypothetical protein HDU80_002210, partial [Chytriomyces hyalinus]
VKSQLIEWKRQIQSGEVSIVSVVENMKANGINDFFFSKFLENHFNLPYMNLLLGDEWEQPFISGSANAPVEILHCVLLGIVKYSMRGLIESLSSQGKQDLKATLEGLSYIGMPGNIHGHSMVHYVHSLIGKDFRAFSQIAPFALSAVVSESVLKMWMSLSRLTCHLYSSTLHSSSYNNNLNTYLDQFILDATSTAFFSTIVKPKMHLLRHIVSCVDRFGPPRLSATESFESFNKVIRNCIHHSSKQNTSKDVALRFATNLSIRHIAAGGCFKLKDSFYNNSSLQRESIITDENSQFRVQEGNFVYIQNMPSNIFLQISEIATNGSSLTGLVFKPKGEEYLG